MYSLYLSPAFAFTFSTIYGVGMHTILETTGHFSVSIATTPHSTLQ